MMGTKECSFSPLPPDVSLEELVREGHFYRRLEERLDLSFVRGLVAPLYAGGGRPRASTRWSSSSFSSPAVDPHRSLVQNDNMVRRRSRRRQNSSSAGRILSVLGAALLISTVVVVARGPWLATVLDIVPTEEEWTRPFAMLLAGVIALVSLTAAAYLSLEEWREAKHRRAEANEQSSVPNSTPPSA